LLPAAGTLLYGSIPIALPSREREVVVALVRELVSDSTGVDVVGSTPYPPIHPGHRHSTVR
jgi:hypothetical protein